MDSYIIGTLLFGVLLTAAMVGVPIFVAYKLIKRLIKYKVEIEIAAQQQINRYEDESRE